MVNKKLFLCGTFFLCMFFAACSKNPDKIKDGFVLIQGSTYTMGSDEIRVPWQYYGHPAHNTEVGNFYICSQEVTQKEFEEIMGYNPSYFQGQEKGRIVEDGEDQSLRPVEKITWYEAIVFCNRLSQKMELSPVYYMEIDGKKTADVDLWGKIPEDFDEKWNNITRDKKAVGYRLPTEVEWEYAARGGEKTEFTAPGFNVNGDDVDSFCWNDFNSKLKSHQTKLLSPNTFGLYDMAGNVWEFCWDWFDEEYYLTEEATQKNPEGPSSADYKVVRGGAWDDEAEALSYVTRGSTSPHLPSRRIGFRLARNAKNKKK